MKSNKKRSKSSQQWLQQHFNDPYVKAAQRQGYRSRAAFKLQEIQQKDHIIRPDMNVVDLGAAPGSWCQMVLSWLKGRGQLFALDILEMEPLESVQIIQGDFTNEAVLQQLMDKLGAAQIDVILSDIAPNSSGVKAIDQPRAMYMAELALDFARQVLKPHGTFVVKVFQGEGFDPFLAALKQHFVKVVVRKPESSRTHSREVYLLGKDFCSK